MNQNVKIIIPCNTASRKEKALRKASIRQVYRYAHLLVETKKFNAFLATIRQNADIDIKKYKSIYSHQTTFKPSEKQAKIILEGVEFLLESYNLSDEWRDSFIEVIVSNEMELPNDDPIELISNKKGVIRSLQLKAIEVNDNVLIVIKRNISNTDLHKLLSDSNIGYNKLVKELPVLPKIMTADKNMWWGMIAELLKNEFPGESWNDLYDKFAGICEKLNDTEDMPLAYDELRKAYYAYSKAKNAL